MAVNKERKTNNYNTDKTLEIMMSFQFDSPLITRITIESDDETDENTQNEQITKRNNNVIIVGTKTSAAIENDININPDIPERKSLQRPETLRPDEIVSIFWENVEEFPEREIPIKIMCHDDEEFKDKTNTKNEKSKNTVCEPKSKRRKSNTPETSNNKGQKIESFGVVKEILKKTDVSHPKQICAEIKTKNSDMEVTGNSKRHFPRTKVTSRREIKKFPGKMDSMRKHVEEIKKNVKETKSVESNVNEVPIKPTMHSYKTNTKTQDTIAKPHDSMRRQLENGNITHKSIYTNEDTVTNECVPGTPSVPKVTDTSITENTNYEKTFEPHLYKMLKKLSETLLTLFPLISNYVIASQTRPVMENDVKEASIKLNESKRFCFDIMHSWVKTLILPFKEDSKYMEAFLVLTSSMAKKRRLESFSMENLKLLCAEMIDWTEYQIRLKKEARMKQTIEWRNHHQQLANQRCEDDQFQQLNLSQIQNPTLTSILTKGPAKFQATKASYPQIQKGQQNIINYHNESSEKTVIQHAYNYSESSSRHEYSANNSIRNAQNQQNQNGINNFGELADLDLLANGTNFHGVTNSNSANSPYATSGRLNEQSVSRLETARASVMNVASLPAALKILNPPGNVNTSSVVQNLNQPGYPPPPYPAYVPDMNPCNPLRQLRRKSSHHQSYSDIQNIQIQQQDTQTCDPNRARRAVTPVQQRSLSRDSGIMTPTHDQMNWPNTDSYAPSLGENAGSSFNPMITKVSSMNPDAVRNMPSYCSVCGTFTNLSCMQCSSIYYCTVQCQASDWHIHSLLCTKKT